MRKAGTLDTKHQGCHPKVIARRLQHKGNDLGHLTGIMHRLPNMGNAAAGFPKNEKGAEAPFSFKPGGYQPFLAQATQ
jgi:hypothetical protein